MKFIVLTLFPELFDSFLKTSLIARGISKKIIDINARNLRDWTTDRHKSVDDRPYGGGVGMVLRVDVIDRALADIKTSIIASGAKQSLSKIPNSKFQIKSKDLNPDVQKIKTKTILLTPQGKPYTQRHAERLAKKYDNLILIAGHYEGFDERVRGLVDEEISIGDYVLTGGELPAMVVIDTISRLVPQFLGKEDSSKEESFSLRHLEHQHRISTKRDFSATPRNDKQILLEYPHYTRPAVYITASTKKPKRLIVPKILLSGDHKKVVEWRLEQAFKRTQKNRPDLLVNH